MKLIIDIPDNIYKFIKDRGHLPYAVSLANVIKDGIPYEERPTGEWKNCDGEIYCSNCGVECAYDETGYILGRFCHNCGANMRSAQNLSYANNDTAQSGLASAT